MLVDKGRSFLLLDMDILLEVVSHVSVLQKSHRRLGEDVCLTVGKGLHKRLVHLLFIIFFGKVPACLLPYQIRAFAVLLVPFNHQHDTYGVFTLAHIRTKYAVAKRFGKKVVTYLFLQEIGSRSFAMPFSQILSCSIFFIVLLILLSLGCLLRV